MEDRELLELAAKAAGITFNGGTDEHGAYEECWNPLAYDGDALRLAVKLRIHIGIVKAYPNANVYPETHMLKSYARTDIVAADCIHRGDEYTATRRAIVRAAAEIGKAMNE